MTPATATTPRDTRRVAYWALLGCTLLVATVTFVLSFSGLDDYGRRVAGLGGLSPLVPIGIDGLTLCAVAATFLLSADTPLRVRTYVWSVFAVAVALSVAGNLSHAAAKALSWEGRIGAAAWPILLALASHLVIVVRRNMEQPRAGRTATTPAATAPPAAPPAAAPVRRQPPATPAPATTVRTPRQPRPAAPGRDNDLLRQRARDMWKRDTRDLTVIATTLRTNRRNVERWTQDLRQAAAGDNDTQERHPGAELIGATG